MIVKVWLKLDSQPREFEDVENTYVKGSFFCIFKKESNKVTKYPINQIFRVQITKAVDLSYAVRDISVQIILEATQEPIVKHHVFNTYTNNGFYSLESLIDINQEIFSLVKIEMYPLAIIDSVIEPYF